ncbi:dihydrofolate reductase [Peptoniphilus equinus]|uniref:dihydrofolate reductase n=1 Tax=Peptoniphilus equinus TaxID=3016343 RepID=A0ABY7QRY8_9FIRM|nr:dihydrofolate reductase [Peptoniphilus equinus]WBW49550.1 dihydrofolate reductase [Peptoniphilus equinus]
MFAIVNVDANWGIGTQGDMLIHLKSDLEFFKTQTMDKTVLMGRNTYESLPNKMPLPGRRNIILSRHLVEVEGFDVVHSPEEAMARYAETAPEDFVVIGGAAIYKMFLDYCDTALVTQMHRSFDRVDTYFPNLDELGHWVLADRTDTIHDPQVDYHISTYKNRQVKFWDSKLF